MSLSTTRGLNSFYFHRSIFSLSLHLLFRFHHGVPPDKLKVLKCSRDDDCGDFLPWLERKAGMEISSALSIGRSKFGRSLLACKNIQAGDCLLKVPFNVQFSLDSMLPEIKCLLGDKVGIAAKLAVGILYEQRKSQDSEWAPYVTRLPPPGDMHSTIFWSEGELEMIRQSSVYQETIDLQARLRKDYLAIKPVLDRFPELFKDVTFEDFRHAYGLVGSRAWGSIKGLSLIPFADFLNHDGTSDSVVLSDEDKQFSEVIADRNYIQGEEVLIRYGRFPNSTLLLDFGFTIPFNLYDQVCIQVDIPCDDPLGAMKLDLLHRHCPPKIKDSSFSSRGGSFVIKKVRSSKGKGKGIPMSLWAFARVLRCTSCQELNDLAMEASHNDGRLARHPLINRSEEIHAHQILLSLIDELIKKYDVSIKSLRTLRSTNYRTSTLRRQMARDLLTGEVDILRSASAWLKNYCFSYQGQRKNTDPVQLRNTATKTSDNSNQETPNTATKTSDNSNHETAPVQVLEST